VSREANLSQALHLVNGDTITQKIAQSRVIATLLAEKRSPEKIIEELYVRAIGRKPTADETQELTGIVNEDLGNPDRLAQLASAQARLDQNYRRGEEQLETLKTAVEKLRASGGDAAAIKRVENQMQTLERQLGAIRQRYQGNAAQLVYGDILWGLFNSTEFAFNH
jgi:hypothetical protein